MRALLVTSLLALTLSFDSPADCEPDQATISFVPPGNAQVLFIEQCGGITCWTRWMESDGKRIQTNRACEVRTGSGPSDIRVMEPQP